MQNNLKPLQQWSNRIFPDNIVEGYLVIKTFFREYDFKNQGYWMRLNPTGQNDFLLSYMGLEPTNPNERKLVDPRGVLILYKMTPSEAEKLSDAQKRNIFMVFKIKATLKDLEQQYTRLKVRYTLTNPIIEFFWDESLTKKISALSIDAMITK